MKTLKLISILFVGGLILILFSCGDKETIEEEVEEMELFPDYTELQTVTGLYMYDANGAPIGTVGNSNHKHEEGIAVYPIPATTQMIVQSSNFTVDKVYLIEASCFKDSSGLDLILASDTLVYSDAALMNKSLLTIEPKSDMFALNLSDLESGFYRLFVLLNNGEFYWYNTFIDPSVLNIPDVAFYNDGCQ